MDPLIEIECPLCHASLWVDVKQKSVVQHKKSDHKAASSLEELLNKEKEKKDKADERFLQARELERIKKKKAAEFFDKTIKEK